MPWLLDAEVATELTAVSGDPPAYESAMKQMSRRGWRTQEPGHLGPPEQPRLLRQATDLLEESGTSVEEIAGRMGLPVERVEELLGPPSSEHPVVTV